MAENIAVISETNVNSNDAPDVVALKSVSSQDGFAINENSSRPTTVINARVPLAEYDALVRQYDYSSSGVLRFNFLPIRCASIDIRPCSALHEQRKAQGVSDIKHPLIQDAMITLTIRLPVAGKSTETKEYSLIYSCWQIVRFFHLLNQRYSPFYLVPEFPKELLTNSQNGHAAARHAAEVFDAWSAHPATICHIITSLFSYVGCNPWLRSDEFVKSFFTLPYNVLESEFEKFEKLSALTSSLKNNAGLKTSTVQFNNQTREFFQKSNAAIANFFRGGKSKDKSEKPANPTNVTTSSLPVNNKGIIVGDIDSTEDATKGLITFTAKNNINDAMQNAMSEYVLEYESYVTSFYNLVNTLVVENSKRLKCLGAPLHETMQKIGSFFTMSNKAIQTGANVSPFIIPQASMALNSLATSLVVDERFLKAGNTLLRVSALGAIAIARSAINCFKGILKMRQGYLAEVCDHTLKIKSLNEKKAKCIDSKSEKLIKIVETIKDEEVNLATARANVMGFTSYLQHAVITIKEVTFTLLATTIEKYYAYKYGMGMQLSEFAKLGINAFEKKTGPIVQFSRQNGNTSLAFPALQKSDSPLPTTAEEVAEKKPTENVEVLSTTANGNILAEDNWMRDDGSDDTSTTENTNTTNRDDEF